MSESETKLLSLLFSEGRELKNLKFFPGPECASFDQLSVAAHEAISAALKVDGGDMIPQGDTATMSIAELVDSL